MNSREFLRHRSNVEAYAALIKQAVTVSDANKLYAQITGGRPCGSRILGNLLVEMFGRLGQLQQARRVFQEIAKPNTFSWNILVQANAQCGQMQEAMAAFKQTPVRSPVSWSGLIAAFASNGRVDDASSIYRRMPAWNMRASTAMVGAFAGKGQMREAWNAFEAMQERDVVSWTVILSGHAEKGETRDAFFVFSRLPSRDAVCYKTMLQGFALHGHLQSALELFEQMPERGFQAWSTMIFACTQHGHCTGLLQLFRSFELEGMPPNEELSINFLAACGHSGLVEAAHQYFISMVDRGLAPCIEHFHCIVDALARTGRLQEAQELIQSMPYHPLDVPWTSLLDACRVQGHLEMGAEAAQQVLMATDRKLSPYSLLSNIFAMNPKALATSPSQEF